MILRLMVSACVAVLVSLLLFSFMVKLLAGDKAHDMVDQAVTRMQFVALPEQPPEPPPQQDAALPLEPAISNESELMAVATLPQSVAAPIPVMQAAPALQDFAISAPESSANWALSVAGGGFDVGEKGKGYVEVIPLATRRPNIPERAWRNKIDGWVLVAFTLKPDGRTANVRILDAAPGGVFEELVVRAVQDWLYDMRSIKHKGDIILTQKIELFWKDYPDNSPYLD